MNFNLFTPLSNQVDAATAAFVGDFSTRVIDSVVPVAAAGAAIWVVIYGLMIAKGMVEPTDFFFRAVKMATIISLAAHGSIYQSQIAQVILHSPDTFAAYLTGAPQGPVLTSAIDLMAGMGFSAAQDAFDKAGTFSMDALAYVTFAVLLDVCVAVFTAIGIAVLLLAKVMLAMLAGLGPLFILALLFKPTASLFERWMGHVLGYTFQIIFTTAIFGFMLAVFTRYVSQVNFDSGMSFAGMLGGCVILCVVFLFILIKLPDAASSLGGGISVGLWHEARIASRMRSQAAGAAGGAARGAVAMESAGYRAAQASSGAIQSAVGKFKGSRAA